VAVEPPEVLRVSRVDPASKGRGAKAEGDAHDGVGGGERIRVVQAGDDAPAEGLPAEPGEPGGGDAGDQAARLPGEPLPPFAWFMAGLWRGWSLEPTGEAVRVGEPAPVRVPAS
jgi:hypothetical protein